MNFGNKERVVAKEQPKQPLDKWEKKDLDIQVGQAMNLAQAEIHQMEMINNLPEVVKKSGKPAPGVMAIVAKEELIKSRTELYFRLLTEMKKKLVGA